MAQIYRFPISNFALRLPDGACRIVAINHDGRLTKKNMETVNWKIEGMSCSTCALTINKYLEKKGLENIKVSLASGDVSFDSSGGFDQQSLQKGIQDLGYTVVKEA